MNRSPRWVSALCSVSMLLALATAHAQTTDASITGVVTDTTGAVIPEAQVTASLEPDARTTSSSWTSFLACRFRDRIPSPRARDRCALILSSQEDIDS